MIGTKKATDFGISFLNHYFYLIYKRKTNFMAEIIGRVGWRNYVSPISPLWNNLVAYYSGDSTANDSKGTKNLSLVNGATYAVAKINNGFSFDGINDYLNYTGSLGISGDFSISLWVNPSVLGGTKPCLQSYNFRSLAFGSFDLYFNGNTPMFQMCDLGGGFVNQYFSTTISTNNWYHLVISFNNTTKKCDMYVNGSKDSGSSTMYFYNCTSADLNNGIDFGLRQTGVFYNGLMDEIAIWNRTLTTADVTELYNAGAGKQYVAPVVSLITTGLVMNLDASNALSYTGTGTSWTDLSGGGNNGTLLNGTSYSSENGGTLVLDGINDYVKINNGTGLNLGNEYTFSIWVKFNNFNAVLAGADMWDYYYLMYVGDSNNIYTSGAGGSGSFSGLNITTNQWVCLTIVRSAASNTLYKNGVYIASGNPSNSGIVKAIGAYASGSFNLNGKISSVNAYNRSLSSTEVTQNFNATKTRFGL